MTKDEQDLAIELTSYFMEKAMKSRVTIEELIKNVGTELIRAMDYDGTNKWGISFTYAKKLGVDTDVLFNPQGNYTLLDLCNTRTLIKTSISEVNNEPEDLHSAS